MAKFDYTNGGDDIDIISTAALEDPDNETLDASPHVYSPALGLCFPDKLWSAWSDFREEISPDIYSNYNDDLSDY